MKSEISSYLREYARGHKNGRPKPDAALVEHLRQNPREAFACITEATWERPAGLDARELDLPLINLLVVIADQIPNLIIPRLGSDPYMMIPVAAASQCAIFIEPLIELLSSRSSTVRFQILWQITRYPHLRMPEALPRLEHLRQLKSFRDAPILAEAIAACNGA